jgi:cytochrome P450
MKQASLYQQVLDFANRANPYPLYAQLRETPVVREADGTWVVSTYREILALLHDPRITSVPRHPLQPGGATATSSQASEAGAATARPDPGSQTSPAFIVLDPPQHDRLRRLAQRPFGPPHTPGRIDGLGPELSQIADRLIDGFRGRSQIDVVEDFAYPLPVTVICELLGVPREDEPRFHAWADTLVGSVNAGPQGDPVDPQREAAAKAQAVVEISQYMAELVEAHRKQPGDDLLSGLATDDGPEGRMSDPDLVSTASLLLLAGHGTTVNLIANGMLTLLRHPDVLQRVRGEPDLLIGTVEELLRYEPPVQLLAERTALADLAVAGSTIPKGSPVVLVLAAGNRDPARFADPERFDPDRKDNQHLGFGSGIHYCFGAPLARLQVQMALAALVRRLENPRLVVDPPPYRQNPIVRGPQHLPVQFDGVNE